MLSAEDADSEWMIGGDEFLVGEKKQAGQSLQRGRPLVDRWSGGDWSLFQQLLSALRQVADRHETSIACVASAWALYNLGGVAGGWVVIGLRDAAHLGDHLKVCARVQKDPFQICHTIP